GLILGAILANAETVLPLTQEDQFSVIEFNLAGQKLRAILDTGSNVNVMDPKWELLLRVSDKKQQVRTSDQRVQKYKKGTAALELEGKKTLMDFVLSSTQVSKKCCDVILGKPFFEQFAVLFDRTNSQVKIAPDLRSKKTLYEFAIPHDSKEILIDCALEKEKVKARLDMGSQQAIDITGAYAEKIRNRSFIDLVYLDTLLQPGFSLGKIDIHCGKWALGKKIVSVLQPLSQSALGQGIVAFNIGAPILNTFDILFDLPNEKIKFLNLSSEPLMFNSWMVFVTSDVVNPNRVLVKSVLAGGLGDKMGLLPGDHIRSINEQEVRGTAETYRLIEDTRVKKYAVEIGRKDQSLSLNGTRISFFPEKVSFPQTFYGSGIGTFGKKASSQLLKPDEVQSIRMVLRQVWADFSLVSFMDGLSVRTLLFKPFFAKQKMDKNGSLSFEGLVLDKKGGISVAKDHTLPSLGISNCKNIRSTIETYAYADTVVDFKNKMTGCRSNLSLLGTFYFFKKEESLDLKLADLNKNLFYLQRDQNSLAAYRWRAGKVKLVLDSKAPEWVEEEVRFAAGEYNKILSPKFELEFERGELDLARIADPTVHGIYWSDQGQPFDGETRFAVTATIAKPDAGEVFDGDIILRSPEFFQFENTIDGFVVSKSAESPKKVEEFNKWRAEKVGKMRRNVILHELGHLLGLAHNFSKKENSIMGYSDRQDLAEYDKAALRFLYYDETPKREFELVDIVATSNSTPD
ncbi:MAG: matrixin family metalloprotease, partial [Pseudobdellovibrionaceae bacterium]